MLPFISAIQPRLGQLSDSYPPTEVSLQEPFSIINGIISDLPKRRHHLLEIETRKSSTQGRELDVETAALQLPYSNYSVYEMLLRLFIVVISEGECGSYTGISA